jgi:hypothetical protein
MIGKHLGWLLSGIIRKCAPASLCCQAAMRAPAFIRTAANARPPALRTLTLMRRKLLSKMGGIFNAH